MARSAQITVTKVHNNAHRSFLPRKDASFSPGSLNRCDGGLDREKYVRGEGTVRYAGVGDMGGDPSNVKLVSDWGAKAIFGGIVEMMGKDNVGRMEDRVI